MAENRLFGARYMATLIAERARPERLVHGDEVADVFFLFNDPGANVAGARPPTRSSPTAARRCSYGSIL